GLGEVLRQTSPGFVAEGEALASGGFPASALFLEQCILLTLQALLALAVSSNPTALLVAGAKAGAPIPETGVARLLVRRIVTHPVESDVICLSVCVAKVEAARSISNLAAL